MKKNYIWPVFSALLILLGSANLMAQEDYYSEPYDTLGYQTRVEQAAAAIQALKNGVLVMRLRSDHRKIEVLERQLATPNLKEKYRTRLQHLLEDTRRDVAIENQHLLAAFREHFDFTEVLFMYDTAIYSLNRGVHKGIFLNDSLLPDSTISLAGRPYRLARFGSLSGMNHRKSLIGMDLNFKDLPAPFPTSGNVSVWEGIALIFKKNDTWKSNYHFHVSRFNKQLHKFFEKCKSKGWLKE